MTVGVLKGLGGPGRFPRMGHRPLTPHRWFHLRPAHTAPPRIRVQGSRTSSLGGFSGVPLRSPFNIEAVPGARMG